MSTRIVNPNEDHFDLLPFIAILMCFLGSLLLVTLCTASVNMGPGAGEGWIPTTGTNGLTKTPVLVEWDGEKVVIHRDGTRQTIEVGTNMTKWFARSGELANPELLAFSMEMSRRSSSNFLLFAVRPSGFRNFQVLAYEFRTNGVPIGYEPIEQTKPVRLKLSGDLP
jgi:hypothetical protein